MGWTSSFRPNPTCQRVGCEEPGVWTPAFTLHVEELGQKEARSTLSFCEGCREYAIEAILPDLVEQVGFPWRLAGYTVDDMKTVATLERIPRVM